MHKDTWTPRALIFFDTPSPRPPLHGGLPELNLQPLFSDLRILIRAMHAGNSHHCLAGLPELNLQPLFSDLRILSRAMHAGNSHHCLAGLPELDLM